MVDASERILILSAVVLVIIVWLPNSGLIQTIVAIDDVEVEIDTSRDYYYLGDSFTANVYLVNTRSKDVWMEPVSSLSFSGVSKNDPEPAIGIVDISWTDKFHIPANSKAQLLHQGFKPKFLGEFIITCLGARKKVLILESNSENETVNAMMNKHSFKKTDEATLFITNVGLNRITLGDKYEIQKKDGDLWVEVPASLHHPNIWLMYLDLLDSGNVFRQEVTIDALEIGQYRISKTVEDSVTPESYTLIIEFEILG